ncbi:MAG: glycosyltransferase, partial [Nitrospiraceae bacterium]|nr:glycosyltransferase [Nitrospiraceae bacterium]
MNALPEVSVIIVTWNGKEVLRNCLEHLYQQTYQNFEVIVVDNGSSDGTQEFIQKFWPQVRLLSFSKNLGFALANNVAAARARGKWIVLLNNDAFPEPNWLKCLLDARSRWPDSAVFTSHQLMAERNGYLDGTGDQYFIFGAARRRDYMQPAIGHSRPEGPVFGFCGAACLINKDIFIALGGFDEDFFCYFEDVDLSWRIRLAGYEICYVPKAIVRHIGSKTVGKRKPWTLYHSYRNQIWTIFKNIPLPLLFLTLPLHFCYTLYLITRVYRSSELRRACIRGKIDAFKELPRFLKKRKEILSSRRAT